MDTEFVSPFLAIRELRQDIAQLFKNDGLFKPEVENILHRLQQIEDHLQTQHGVLEQVCKVLQEKLGVEVDLPAFEPVLPLAIPPGERSLDSHPEGRASLDQLDSFQLKPLPEE